MPNIVTDHLLIKNPNSAKVFTAGVTASFGVATTSGTSVTASVACPDNVTCGLTASPLMLKIQGKQTYELCGSGLSYDKTFPCEYAAPDWCPTTTFNTTVGEGFDYTAVCISFLAVWRMNLTSTVDPSCCRPQHRQRTGLEGCRLCRLHGGRDCTRLGRVPRHHP